MNGVQNYSIVLSGEINKPFPRCTYLAGHLLKVLLASWLTDENITEKKKKQKTPKRHEMILKLQTDFA